MEAIMYPITDRDGGKICAKCHKSLIDTDSDWYQLCKGDINGIKHINCEICIENAFDEYTSKEDDIKTPPRKKQKIEV